MPITVRKLITELEKIDNKFLEVEMIRDDSSKKYEVDYILSAIGYKKVLIRLKELKIK